MATASGASESPRARRVAGVRGLRDRGRGHARIALPVAVLGAMLALWSATFVALGLLRQRRFGTFGFDLGIYDQGVWLLSRLHDPFVTVRGIDLFGHHANVVLLGLAPFYRFGAGPEFLLVVQVLAQASGAVALYLLARDVVGSEWSGVGCAAVLLLNPTYQFLAWEYFHPDAVAIAPLLFAYWAARTQRWPWFVVAAVLALSCKEDVALAMAVLGGLVAWRGAPRIGGAIAAVSLAWFVTATRVLIPFFNGRGPFYDSFFGPELGSSPGEWVVNVVEHPSVAYRRLYETTRVSWYWKMLAPFALLPLASLRTFAIAGPMIVVNALTWDGYPYTRHYEYHYSALVVAAGALATVEAIAWISRRAGVRGVTTALVTVVVGAALATSIAWGPSPIGARYDDVWPLERDGRDDARRAALALVPDGAAASASYSLVPHLTHRTRIYEFPVPWCNVNWGVEGEGLHDPAVVQWLVIDRQRVDPGNEALLASLLDREFRVHLDRDDVVVAERVRASAYDAAVPRIWRCRGRVDAAAGR